MQDEHLTVDDCDELVEALFQDAAALPDGSERENLLKLEHPPLKLTRSHRGRNSFGIPEARSRR